MSYYDRNQGLDIARAALAMGRAHGKVADSLRNAEQDYGRNSAAAVVVRASVGIIGPTSPGWAAELAEIQAASESFIQLAAESAVWGQLPCVPTPINTASIIESGEGLAEWVGEAEEIPAINPDFSRLPLPSKKVAAIVVFSRELLEFSTLSAELALRDSLRRSVNKVIDTALLDPANAGTTAKPASITYGAPTVSDGGDLQAGLSAAAELFEGSLERCWFIARPSTYLALAGADHPNAGLRGGELCGAPAIASSALPPAETSPQLAGDLLLVDPARIAMATGLVTLDVAHEATIKIGGQLVDLWGKNLVAIRCVVEVNWAAAPGAVVRISSITT